MSSSKLNKRVDIDETLAVRCINGIRCLAAALPEGAKSGHPGAPLGCSAIVYALFMDHMRFSTENRDWMNRDRFILSNGHACALLYTICHLLGYLELNDLKQFRALNSLCPGHPERHVHSGVEVTTGPLGQGIAQAVGLAVASLQLAERYNKPDVPKKVFDNYVYCLLGDGCLQEGISYEACSLAGHLKLRNLIALLDNNNITIDGPTTISTSECVATRFRAINWDVLHVENATNDYVAVSRAIERAKQSADKPTLIICDTVIGFGAKVQGTEKAHGAPIGIDDLLSLRRRLGVAKSENETSQDIYELPSDVYACFKKLAAYSHETYYRSWLDNLEGAFKQNHPSEYSELHAKMANKLSHPHVIAKLTECNLDSKNLSTRQISGKVLNVIAECLPELIGGSADLTTSTCVKINSSQVLSATNHSGSAIPFGIREHGMAGICNGIAAFGFHRVFSSCFLNFITYAWGSVRLSALSHLPVLYVCTHDSIELGEDGPTHQPVEVAALARSTPNLVYFRPADETEVLAAYVSWLSQSSSPYILALCRSSVPNLRQTSLTPALRGAYILEDFDAASPLPKCVLASCGSELHLCLTAYEHLKSQATYNIRVVSMPSWSLFEKESDDYQQQIIPPNIKGLYVEAANALGYHRWFTHAIHMTSFGASAPMKHLHQYFGFTSQNIINKIHEIMS